MTDTDAEQRSIARAAGQALRAARGTATPPATEEVAEVEDVTEVEDSAEIKDGAEAEADDLAPDTDWVDISAKPISTEPPIRSVRASALLIVAATILAAALVLAVVAGVLWWQATPSPARARANDREAVLRAARIDAITMNTLDYQHPQAAINQWLSVTTGSMHDQITRTGSVTPGLVGKAQVSTSATVDAAAVTALDPGRGTASVMLSLRVKYVRAKADPVYARYRFNVSMTQVGGHWLLNDLAPYIPGGQS